MKGFVYDSGIRILYGADQSETVVQEISKLGNRLLIVSADSFLAGGHYKTLERALTGAGLHVTCMNAGKRPLLSKVGEGIRLCTEQDIQVILGIGGGVSMDLAKAIAFGALHAEVPMEQLLTCAVSTQGLSMLPVVTVPTNPMSGSETNADVQITLDESGLQVGCGVGRAVFTWLNPDYMMSLPDSILSMTAQMKAVIDRSYAFYQQLEGKTFYFLITCAATDAAFTETMLAALRGFTCCVPNAEEGGYVLGIGAMEAGEIRSSAAMAEAYALGNRIS